MPIYEYRCPNGHVFELFKKMDEPAPGNCEVCGASPVELVLYPVAIHYKGSGFYATDYGKGKKRAASGEGGSSEKTGSSETSGSPGKSESKSDGAASSSSGETKKAAEA